MPQTARTGRDRGPYTDRATSHWGGWESDRSCPQAGAPRSCGPRRPRAGAGRLAPGRSACSRECAARWR